jgi:hypothetical protein
VGTAIQDPAGKLVSLYPGTATPLDAGGRQIEFTPF